nr:rho GTPase-activating protein 30 [Taeniopygia guttata]
MSLALKARQRARRKGGSRERLFGCDLREHLQRSGQDVPQVLRSCTEFVEQHGVVDGIYRLSGVSSNTQRLRQEFEAQRSPDLSRDVYLQDVHCVSSLCKAYCRELPNPLLTYQLYDKFADAVAIQMEEARLVKIKEVLKELPAPHYRTLEFLMRHLLRMAAHSGRTNMHARNLAIVWAPNLLRSRDIEASGFNGTAAFMEVRVQSIVVEFILTHVEQLFGDAPLRGGDSPRRSLLLPGPSPPLHVPAALSQGDGPPQMRPYHTIIELGEHRSKGSLKAKKWRSIFNLGRSGHEAKRKLVKAEEKEKCGKVTLRPAKSMDSLSSGPSGADAARLLPKLSVKLRPQRQHSSDAAPAAPEPPPELDESLEESLEAAAESSTKSEPTTPKAPRAGPGPCGRSRAEKCAGLHISGPFSVTVPFHITSNLSRLTRGLPCPALQREHTPGSPPEPARDPRPRSEDAEQTRLSLELRDSFAFLDGPETWLEGGGEPEAAARSPGTGDGTPGTGDGTFGTGDETPRTGDGTPGTGDETPGIEDGTPRTEELTTRIEELSTRMENGTPGIEDGTPGIEDGTPGIEDGTPGIEDGTFGIGEGFPAMEEGMESGFMNPGERWAEQPDSYLSIEECTEQDMFFLAPGASEPDSDPDEIFLSAHDELSPLGTPEGPPGEGTALENLENLENREIPEISVIPETSEIPEIPKVLEIPEIPKVLETPEVPKVLEIPEIPKVLEIPEIPETPGIPKVLEILETPETLKALEIPEIPETSEILKLMEIPEIPKILETPEIPKVLETSETPEIPKVLETSETPETPKVLEIPEIPEVLETPEIPKVLETPEILTQTPPEKDLGGCPPAPPLAEPPREPPETPAPSSVTPGTTRTPGAPPKNLQLAQDEPPKNLETPRPSELIWDEPPKIPEPIWDEPPKIPELIPDEPPKIPELIPDEPPKSLQPPKSLEPIWDEPPRPLKLIQDEPPRVSEPPKSPETPKPLEPILAEPPKSWDTPRPLELIWDESPKSRDPSGPPNPIWDGRPKSLQPILAEPPKSRDPPGPPNPIRDGRPKSLGPLPAPPRSSRRPLPILGARVLLARAVPVVPPKPHFAHALPGPPQIPPGPPQIPLGPIGTEM